MEKIPRGRPSGLVKDLYMHLLGERSRLAAYEHGGWWVEIGSPSLYLGAHMRLLGSSSFLKAQPRVAGRLVGGGPGPAFVAEGADSSRAGFLSNVVIGSGCRLEEGARIEDSVMGRDVLLGSGATLKSSIAWDGVRIPPGAEIRGRLLVRRGDGSVEESDLPPV
jgi:NDP-sugar pyrophosphorylase family protein